MRKKIVAGNWKMNKNLAEGISLVEELANGVAAVKGDNVDVVVSPPYVLLSEISKKLQGSPIKVSAQNIHQEESGAYTGEISGSMLTSIGVEAVIIGHSERREYFGESGELIANKVKAAIAKGLTPIYCCGEVKEERENGTYFDVVKGQVSEEVFGLSAADFGKVVIAYEPVWAIGTGLTASPEQAQEIHAFIRGLIVDKYGNDVAQNTSILYGGSCKPGNAKEIFGKEDVDGGLIGGAALQAEDFLAIIEAAKN